MISPTLNFRWLEKHVWVSAAPDDVHHMSFGMRYGHRLTTERVLQQAFFSSDGATIWKDLPVVVDPTMPPNPDHADASKRLADLTRQP